MRRRQRFNALRKNALCFMAASCNRTLGVGILQQTEYHASRSDRTIARSSSKFYSLQRCLHNELILAPEARRRFQPLPHRRRDPCGDPVIVLSAWGIPYPMIAVPILITWCHLSPKTWERNLPPEQTRKPAYCIASIQELRDGAPSEATQGRTDHRRQWIYGKIKPLSRPCQTV